jgi:hypothetical protein
MSSPRWFPLSRKILLGIVPLFLVFISVSVLLQNRFQEREMMQQAQTAAHAYGDIIRESLVSMMVNNLEVDSTFLDRVNMLQQFDTLRIIVNNLRLREELMTPVRAERIRRKLETSSARCWPAARPRLRGRGIISAGSFPSPRPPCARNATPFRSGTHWGRRPSASRLRRLPRRPRTTGNDPFSSF